MNAAQVAHALGNAKRAGTGWQVLCPAHDDHNPSLSLADSPDGKLLVKCWAGCDSLAVLAALRKRALFPSEAKAGLPKQIRVKTDTPLNWSQQAEYIWRATIPIANTTAAQYLKHRGCLVPICPDLRFLPVSQEGKYPAMIARITDAVTGLPISLHYTFLASDGSGKAPIERPKLLLKGHRKTGGVIRLTDDDQVTTGLGIAEGIETALACAASGWQPVWATIDAGNMTNFPVLAGIESLTIFADCDNAGLKAAERCYQIWELAGKQVRIVAPSTFGIDWADVVERDV